jgi:hypothetical protein
MNKFFLSFMIYASILLLTGCRPFVHHSNPFYDYDGDDFPIVHLPLIDPVKITQGRPSSPWKMGIPDGIYIAIPKKKEEEVQKDYLYSTVQNLEKFAIQDGVILAYSAYVDPEADEFIRNNFYHWFVIIPSKKITKGFQAEDEFREYIKTISLQNPVWWTPDEAYHKFVVNGGCMDWIPDCKK